MDEDDTGAAPADRCVHSHPNQAPQRDSIAMSSGALAALVAWPLVLLDSPRPAGFLRGHEVEVASLGALLLASAALLIQKKPLIARLLATLGVTVVVLSLVPNWLEDPAATLLAAIVLLSGMVWLFDPGGEWLGGASQPLIGGTGYLRGAIVAALFSFSYWLWAGSDPRPGSLIPVIWAGAVASGLGLWRVYRRARLQPRRSWLLFGVHVLAAGAIATNLQTPLVVVGLPVACALLVGVTLRRTSTGTVARGSFWEFLLGHPERMLVGTFAFFSILGALALSLPASSTGAGGLDFIDALFTSTSAICVTGLVTIDPSVDLTQLGQVFVLILIQVGGLGIMTFSTVVLWALGRRMSLRHETPGFNR